MFEKCKQFSKTGTLLYSNVIKKDNDNIIITPVQKGVDNSNNNNGLVETCLFCSNSVISKKLIIIFFIFILFL